MALLITIVVTTIEIIGIISAIVALYHPRTSQGTIAWIVSLLTIPFVAVPLYWIFGRNKFHGYSVLRQKGDAEFEHLALMLRNQQEGIENFPLYEKSRLTALKRLARLPYTQGTKATLLIDGDATFRSIFAGIAAAQEYILVQFFIVHDDLIGRELKNNLIIKAQQGVRVYFLYDEMGSHALGDTYLDELKSAGVRIHSFHSTRNIWNRFQINFRNHRKIVLTDGKLAWIGGHNVGDEYLGRSKKFGHWRDTHILLDGPAVTSVQLSFVEDWFWATDEKLTDHLTWDATHYHKDGHTFLILPSGPADEFETASLMIQQAIQEATERFWIASAYFVPDEGVKQALHLAALRGVDVRILIPDIRDHWLPYLSIFAIAEDMIKAGIKIYRYDDGFLHQKVFVVDELGAAVGTANLDNRSFRLNFEITAIGIGPQFANTVAKMLEDDFDNAFEMTTEFIHDKPFYFKLASHAAYLTAPVQ
jgi:cardiolipin synthase